MKINTDIVNDINTNHYGTGNSKKYITIHQTDNTNQGANAKNHSKYIRNATNSWHYTVDDEEIIQHFTDDIRCWHTGTRVGNDNSIGIELCVNSDGDYLKTIQNSISLVKVLMDRYKIPYDRVIQHNYWSGKDCPSYIRKGYKGINWYQYKNKLKDKLIVDSFNIDFIARETIKGKYGNGKERKAKLGNKYSVVQKRVNQILQKK